MFWWFWLWIQIIRTYLLTCTYILSRCKQQDETTVWGYSVVKCCYYYVPVNYVKQMCLCQCHPGHYRGPTMTATAVVQAGDGEYLERLSAGVPAGCCRYPAASSTPWNISPAQRQRPSASSASLVSAPASRNCAMISRLTPVRFRSFQSLRCYLLLIHVFKQLPV